MILVLNNADMSQMYVTRPSIRWICIGINQWPSRRRSWRYHPFAACDLGFEEAISQNRYYRDRIEDKDQQHHDIDKVDVQPVVGDGDHKLEAYPVKQRQSPGQFCIPWTPEPVRSARRRRGRLLCRFDVINILHSQSPSREENSTASLGMKSADNQYGGPPLRGNPSRSPPLRSFHPHPAPICSRGLKCRRVQRRNASPDE